MSGEPKTHTPEPMTLEEAMVRVAWQGDGYRLEPVAPRRTRHMPTRATSWRAVHATGYAKDFDTWEEAASYVLGVRVAARDDTHADLTTAYMVGLKKGKDAARDEAAELRAAIKRFVATMAPDRPAYTIHEKPERSVAYREWREALDELRRLAGGESEEEQP